MHRKLSMIEFIGGIALLVAAIVVVRRRRAGQHAVSVQAESPDELPKEALEPIKNGLFIEDRPGRVNVITINVTNLEARGPLLNV